MAQVERMADKGDLPVEAEELMTSPGSDLWNQVIKGANSALKGGVVDEASETQPGLHGTSGEDMAQVMAVGGVMWPGKKMDFRYRAYPDAPEGTQAAKIMGVLMDRDEPVFKSGDNIFMEVGRIAETKNKDLGADIGYLNQTAFNRAYTYTRSWVRSVNPFKTVQLPPREEEMEMMIPGYEGPGDITAMNLSNPYFINAIDDEVSRLVANNPAQKWLWGAITMATGKGNRPLVRPVKGGTPPLSLEASALMKWVEDNDYPPAPGGRRSVARAWTKLYKQMLKAYDNLSDSVIDRGMTKGPASTLFRDPAVRDVYLQEIRRRRASAHRVVARHRISSRRVAEKWIQQAIKRPGRLHEFFGIPEDETIPMSKITGEIEKLRSKERRTPEETSLLQALNLAVTLKGMNKGASPFGMGFSRPRPAKSLIKDFFKKDARSIRVNASLDQAALSYPPEHEFMLTALMAANGYDPEKRGRSRLDRAEMIVQLYEPGYRSKKAALTPEEKGLLDALKYSPTHSEIIEHEDMRAAMSLVAKGLAEWFTDSELALTALGRRKKAALGPVSLGEMMMSAASQARLFHRLDMKRFVDVYEEVGQNLIRLGHTKQILKEGPHTPSVEDEVAFLHSEIDKGLKFLRSHNIKAMSEALEQMTHAYDLVAGRFR
jgi:hypothetical protein